jgi:hypothetical protein
MAPWHRIIVWLWSNQDASPTQNGSDRPAEICKLGNKLTDAPPLRLTYFVQLSARIYPVALALICFALMVETATFVSRYVTPDGMRTLTLPIFFLGPPAALRLSCVYQW